MPDDKVEQLRGSFNYATDLNRSFNSAANLVQTISQSQNVNTGGGNGTTTNTNSSAGSSGSGTSNSE